MDFNFKLSTLMLCVFHAIWQPFKETIRNKLPRKGTSNVLTDVGRTMG